MPTTSFPFALVDVFSEEPLTGNPLAVVWEADCLSVERMRGIAREFNQSETTFVLRPGAQGAADRRLRSFTPTGAEVVGAGHNALGAWWLLAATNQLGLAEGPATLRQEIGERVLPLQIEVKEGAPSAIRMSQASPVFGEILDDLAELTSALGLKPGDLDTSLPTQVVSTGAGHLMVPARNSVAVDSAEPDAPRLRQVLQKIGGQGCYLFSLDPVAPGSLAYTRFFNPTVGIWEDPATGSAAGPLACHLAARGVVAESAEVVIEQGRSMGRSSLITVHIDAEQVHIAGNCVVTAEGQLRVPTP